MVDERPVFRSPVQASSSPAGGALLLEDVTATAKTLAYAAPNSHAAPVGPGFAARSKAGVEFSVAPGEWFVISPGPSPMPTQGAVSEVDVSHSKVVFRVTGDDAAGVMEKLCALDFDDRFTPDGSAARTSVAKVACEVVRLDRDGSPSYLIQAGRSFGGYLFDALVDAAREFEGEHAGWDGAAL